MGKDSTCALTPWRAATSSISRMRCGLPVGLPVMDLTPEISGNAWMAMGEGGIPTRHSVPVGRSTWM